jgi:hypothetical protein
VEVSGLQSWSLGKVSEAEMREVGTLTNDLSSVVGEPLAQFDKGDSVDCPWDGSSNSAEGSRAVELFRRGEVVVVRIVMSEFHDRVLGDRDTTTSVGVEVLKATGLNGLGSVDRHDCVAMRMDEY